MTQTEIKFRARSNVSLKKLNAKYSKYGTIVSCTKTPLYIEELELDNEETYTRTDFNQIVISFAKLTELGEATFSNKTVVKIHLKTYWVTRREPMDCLHKLLDQFVEEPWMHSPTLTPETTEVWMASMVGNYFGEPMTFYYPLHISTY